MFSPAGVASMCCFKCSETSNHYPKHLIECFEELRFSHHYWYWSMFEWNGPAAGRGYVGTVGGPSGGVEGPSVIGRIIGVVVMIVMSLPDNTTIQTSAWTTAHSDCIITTMTNILNLLLHNSSTCLLPLESEYEPETEIKYFPVKPEHAISVTVNNEVPLVIALTNNTNEQSIVFINLCKLIQIQILFHFSSGPFNNIKRYHFWL